MFHLKVVTPDKIFLDEEVKMLIVRGVEGDLAVMKGLEPLVTPVKVSKMRVTYRDGEEKEAAISQGYLSVEPDITTLVVESAEWPEEIDLRRAEEAKRRAENRLSAKGSDDTDFLRAKLALSRAINRISVKGK